MRFIYRDSYDRRTIDMTPDGQFRRRPGLPIMQRIFLAAVIVAAIAGGLALSALAFWLAMFLLPVALVAGIIAWGILRMLDPRRPQSFGGPDRPQAPDPFRRF
jgi:hypothetical protein